VTDGTCTRTHIIYQVGTALEAGHSALRFPPLPFLTWLPTLFGFGDFEIFAAANNKGEDPTVGRLVGT
jgi:hypothetical protein